VLARAEEAVATGGGRRAASSAGSASRSCPRWRTTCEQWPDIELIAVFALDKGLQ
jgi:hypothetical protein